jgi:VanZ family protein
MTWIVLGAALASGIIIEAGRYFLPARIPSSTDLLISCFGAWVGFLMMQHVRVVFWAERTLGVFAPRVRTSKAAAQTW